MNHKKVKFNLGGTFLMAIMGALFPFLVQVVKVRGDFTSVETYHYFLLALASFCFFLAYQIVKRMNVPRKTDNFYLTVLGVYLLVFIVIGLVSMIVLAATGQM